MTNLIPSPTPEMVEFFLTRTHHHIKAVLDIFNTLSKEFDGVARTSDHDSSKFMEPEKTPYIWLTWKKKCDNEGLGFLYPQGIEYRVQQATDHHVLGNGHHPEYWAGESKISAGDRDKSSACIDASSMPAVYILEMVSDWIAMAQEVGNPVRGWWDKVKDVRWHFDEAQSALIESLIKTWEDHIDH